MPPLHGDEARIEADVVSDDPGVYQSRLDFPRDFFEGRALRNVVIADAVYSLRVRRNRSSRIDQMAGTAHLGWSLAGDHPEFYDSVAHGG